jgi:hypothetical protein
VIAARNRVAAVALCSLAALAGGCGDDDSTSTQADTIGTGAQCTAKLRQAVTPEYLRQSGLGIANPRVARRELTRAIAQVCRTGPATLSVNEAAPQVVRVIEVRFVQ